VLNRLLVPLDPWRYYELGRVGEATFSGRCLDVSSPKLLMSFLQREGHGTWTGIDVFRDEIALWRELDPTLDLDVQDARALRFPDETFDACICVSVIEHIRPDGDMDALGEVWRVLRPGGVLHLTTNVAATPVDIYVDRDTWGEATERIDGRVFFEHRYSEAEITERLLMLPWDVMERETVVERWGLTTGLARIAPVGYVLGPLLRFAAPHNFTRITSAEDVRRRFGVTYLQLRKPE
jgi:SAM-dependent methyltransferase